MNSNETWINSTIFTFVDYNHKPSHWMLNDFLRAFTFKNVGEFHELNSTAWGMIKRFKLREDVDN